MTKSNSGAKPLARRRRALFGTLMLSSWLFVSGAAAEEPEPLRIVGSGYSMPVLMRPWTEAFTARTGIEVEVVPSGTSTGPPALIEGRADIAAMTRPLRDAEATALRVHFGAAPVTISVARDEVAVFVNAANPLERMTLAQIDAVYSQERRCGAPEDVTRWGQLGVAGAYADRAIALFGRRPGSGTAAFFRTHALCDGDFKDWMRISPGQTSASLRVVESRFGIGFGSLRDQRPGMKAIAVARDAESPYVRPGEPNPSTDSPLVSADSPLASADFPLASADYALARTFDFVVPKRAPAEQHPALIDFLESVLAPEAQAAATVANYSPLTSSQRAMARERVASLSGAVSVAPPSRSETP